MPTLILYTLFINLHLQLILSVSSPFTLQKHEYILSNNSLVRLAMQSDGNLAMHSRSSISEPWTYAGWSTDTNPYGDHLELQNDGELVVFNTSGGIEWTSNSITGTAPFRLIVSDDIAAYILDSSNVTVWSTNPFFSTIWSDTFDSNINEWFLEHEDDVILPSTSSHCPNYPDNCIRIGNPYNSIIKSTVISNYSAIQFQFDVTGYNLEWLNDVCLIWWMIDGGEWIVYPTRYDNAVYKDVIIDIPLPDSYTSIKVAFQVSGLGVDDFCYFDNAILRGILIQSDIETTDTPDTPGTTTASSSTTADVFNIIWSDTMDNNNNSYWEITNHVAFGDYAECPGDNPPDGSYSCAFVAADDGYSAMNRVTDVSHYVNISLKVDLVVDGLESDDVCRITWRYEADVLFDYTTDGIYDDIVIEIDNPGNDTLLGISLVAFGDSNYAGDKCYFDNIFLRGNYVNKTANNEQTMFPTAYPTKKPTQDPTNNNTAINPTINQTINPTINPIINPIMSRSTAFGMSNTDAMDAAGNAHDIININSILNISLFTLSIVTVITLAMCLFLIWYTKKRKQNLYIQKQRMMSLSNKDEAPDVIGLGSVDCNEKQKHIGDKDDHDEIDDEMIIEDVEEKKANAICGDDVVQEEQVVICIASAIDKNVMDNGEISRTDTDESDDLWIEYNNKETTRRDKKENKNKEKEKYVDDDMDNDTHTQTSNNGIDEVTQTTRDAMLQDKIVLGKVVTDQ